MRTVLGRVLVIDDDPLILKAIVDLLERAGFRVVAQASALGAAQVIIKERIDAAVIDWNLPLLRGDEVIRLLRGWDEVKDLPVLLISGAPDETLARIREELPGIFVLGKDRLRDELVRALGSVLSSGQTIRGLKPIESTEHGEFGAAPQPRLGSHDLSAELLTQLADVMSLMRTVWSEVMRGNLERMAALLESLDLLAGQARLLALEETADLLQALSETLRTLPADGEVARDVRRAIEGGIDALSALPQGGDGAFTVLLKPSIGALRKASERPTS